MQRFYLSGRLDYAYQSGVDLLQELSGVDSLQDLLWAKWEEPIAGCLGGYLMLRFGKANELETAVRNMSDFFGGLSDSHVLKAEYEASQGRNDAADAAFRTALDCGLPIFADGLTRLFDGVQRYCIDHPGTALLSKVFHNRVRGLLWSAWTP